MTIDKKSAAALGVIGVGFKLCYALIIDTPRLTGAFALTHLAGALGFLPALLSLGLLERQYPGAEPEELLARAGGRAGRGAYYVLLSLFLLVSATLSAAELIDVATYIALSGQGKNWLNVATVAAVCACALCGCRAVAGASRVRVLLLPLLLLLIVAVQYHSFVPRWLLPLLADGPKVIGREAVALAGVNMLLVPIWMLCGSWRTAACTYGKVTLFTLTVALFYGMLAPTMPFAQHTRFFRLDTLLSNGRTSLSLQLPHMIVVYTGLLTGACFCLSMSARLLGRCFPRVKEQRFVLAGAACVLGLLYTPVAAQENAWLIRAVSYPAQLAPLWALTISGAVRRRSARA